MEHMIKDIARKVLKDELENSNKQIVRLSGIANGLNKEIARLQEERNIPEYSLTPDMLTSEEQKVIEEFSDTKIFDLYEKWFKSKADHNNYLLIHAASATEEQRTMFRLAVLIYEDWKLFTEHCKKSPKKET